MPTVQSGRQLQVTHTVQASGLTLSTMAPLAWGAQCGALPTLALRSRTSWLGSRQRCWVERGRAPRHRLRRATHRARRHHPRPLGPRQRLERRVGRRHLRWRPPKPCAHACGRALSGTEWRAVPALCNYTFAAGGASARISCLAGARSSTWRRKAGAKRRQPAREGRPSGQAIGWEATGRGPLGWKHSACTGNGWRWAGVHSGLQWGQLGARPPATPPSPTHRPGRPSRPAPLPYRRNPVLHRCLRWLWLAWPAEHCSADGRRLPTWRRVQVLRSCPCYLLRLSSDNDPGRRPACAQLLNDGAMPRSRSPAGVQSKLSCPVRLHHTHRLASVPQVVQDGRTIIASRGVRRPAPCQSHPALLRLSPPSAA